MMMVCYKLRDMFNPASLPKVKKKREQGKKRNRLSKKYAMHQCHLMPLVQLPDEIQDSSRHGKKHLRRTGYLETEALEELNLKTLHFFKTK